MHSPDWFNNFLTECNTYFQHRHIKMFIMKKNATDLHVDEWQCIMECQLALLFWTHEYMDLQVQPGFTSPSPLQRTSTPHVRGSCTTSHHIMVHLALPSTCKLCSPYFMLTFMEWLNWITMSCNWTSLLSKEPGIWFQGEIYITGNCGCHSRWFYKGYSMLHVDPGGRWNGNQKQKNT